MEKGDTYQAVVEGSREVLKVEPDVKGRLRWHRNLEAKTLQALENMVALSLEVPLEGNLLLVDVFRVKEGEGGKLQASEQAQIVSEACG